MASALMPYYTISYDQDKKYGENVGNAYSKYIIKDLLRGKYGYDGVVCTDWGITRDNASIEAFGGMCWGVSHLNVNERHYKALMAGVDQFGGNSEIKPVLAAYEMGVAAHGENAMRERFNQSAARLLRNIFLPGLFENPYTDPAMSSKIVGNPEYMKAGYEGQLKSIVMLKNKGNVLPMKRCRVYVPRRHFLGSRLRMIMAGPMEPYEGDAVERSILEKYFDIADKPEDADAAIVFMNSPLSTGYTKEEGYLPISLQYRPYTAEYAREKSIAGGDPHENSVNRSYRGKTNTALNQCDLDDFIAAKKAMGDKPVIVSLNMSNPTVMKEFEALADAILVNFQTQSQAVLDIISGKAEPCGLMPCQTPADMRTVEEQYEDVPFDLKCHTDDCGNTYDFAFGLNWAGVIKDERVKKYR